MRTLRALVLLSVCLQSQAVAQERKAILPLKEFINSVAASQAARITGQREWARTNCPRHLSSNMWLSPLADAYIASLQALDSTEFKRYLANSTAEVSKKKYDFCEEIWVTFLVIEDSASKAYWVAGWQPKR
jgi:hypothetical protein